MVAMLSVLSLIKKHLFSFFTTTLTTSARINSLERLGIFSLSAGGGWCRFAEVVRFQRVERLCRVVSTSSRGSFDDNFNNFRSNRTAKQ